MTEKPSSPPRPISLRLEAGGVPLHYLDWGEGSPRHLVLLHGLGSQAHTWDRFADEVSDSFRVVVPDLRGHGESGHPEDGYALNRFAADVKAVTRHLNIPTFDLVGHSLGALIAIWFTAEHSALVDHLVLVDGGPGLDIESAREGLTESFVRPLGFDTLEEAKGWYQERYPNRSDEWLEQRVEHGMKQNWADKWVFRHDPELYWLLEDGSLGFQEGEQQTWDMLAAITCPVLLLRGQESTLLSPEAARRITDTAPNARLVEIPGAGHSIPSDAPEQFRDAVLEFLGA